MDLTPGRQRLLFVVIVIVLVGLGAYLITSRHSGSGSTAAPASPSPSAGGSSAGGTATNGIPPSVVPTPTPVSTAGGAEIYQWLPFGPAELNQAVNTANTFSAAYATWSYRDSKSSYAARLKNLVTATELTKLVDSWATGGVAQQRTADQQVSTATSSIERIFLFGSDPVSITFAVAVDEQVKSRGSTPDAQVGHYNVAVQQSGSGWVVSDIELQGLGNH